MSGRWFYRGDVNLECGGMWYRLDGWENGYFDVVRVDACSDHGGQDNAWYVEALTGIVPRSEDELASALSCIGCDIEDMTETQQRHAIVDACVAYGLYDPANLYPVSHAETVQIGPKPDGGSEFEQVKPTVTLRANASLERYVRREFLNGRAS